MLPEYHAAGADEPGEQDDQTEPPHGVEGENLREGRQCAGQTADGRHVCGYFPFHVDDRTEHLDDHGRHQHTAHGMGDMEQVDDIIAHEVTHEADEVGHQPSLLGTQFDGRPSLVVAVEADEQRGQQDGKEIDDEQYFQLCPERQEGQVAEHEEQ